MPRVTSNLLAIQHPTNLFSQHGSCPGSVFVYVASSVGELRVLFPMHLNLTLFHSTFSKCRSLAPRQSCQLPKIHFSTRDEVLVFKSIKFLFVNCPSILPTAEDCAALSLLQLIPRKVLLEII